MQPNRQQVPLPNDRAVRIERTRAVRDACVRPIQNQRPGHLRILPASFASQIEPVVLTAAEHAGLENEFGPNTIYTKSISEYPLVSGEQEREHAALPRPLARVSRRVRKYQGLPASPPRSAAAP